jgi:hypothetical protein
LVVNNSGRCFTTLELEYYTPSGLRSGRIIPFSAFKQVFRKFNPDLLETASDYGIAAYTLNLAGYNPQTSPTPLPRDEKKDRQKQHHEMLKHLVGASLYLDISNH